MSEGEGCIESNHRTGLILWHLFVVQQMFLCTGVAPRTDGGEKNRCVSRPYSRRWIHEVVIKALVVL